MPFSWRGAALGAEWHTICKTIYARIDVAADVPFISGKSECCATPFGGEGIMARDRSGRDADDPNGPPVEITMTDLEADEDRSGRGGGDIHAAGTPGGGTAWGGLAGTNVNDGDPDNADLEDAMGAGIHDTGEETEEEGAEPLSGATGGAVGGTPAGLRASGDNIHRGLAPGMSHRGDSTIGSSPDNAP